MASVAYGSLPFSEQIAFFRGKRNVLTESYLDVWEAEHDVAFMVAGANRTDLLADLREAVRKAIDEGATLQDFRRDFDRIAATYGWNYTGGRNWRTRLIYETNLRQSYNAGRWKQLQDVKRARPYWRYKHNDAVEHPRPLHLSWDGIVLSADDDWWLTHYPMNGYGCKCGVEALNARDLKRLGKSGPDKAPPVDWQDVIVGQRSPGGPRIVRTPAGIDPGFGYAPGSSLSGWPQRRGGPQTPPSLRRQVERTVQMALDKTTRLPIQEAVDSAAAILALPRAVDALEAGYVAWQASVLDTGAARDLAYIVGALDAGSVRALSGAGRAPAAATILVRDAQLLDEVSPALNAGQALTLTASELAALPGLLHDPAAVLLDGDSGVLLYVIDAGRRRTGKFVIEVGTGAANAVRAASRMTLAQLQDEMLVRRLRLVRGALE